MKEMRFALLVFGAIALMGILSTLEEAWRLPPVGSLAVMAAMLVAVFRRVIWPILRTERPAERVQPARTGPYVSPYEVRFDDTEVVVLHEDAPDARVAWADLLTVGITIQDHVFYTRPWWLLFGRGGTVASYPSDARGNEAMLRELQRRLPGFDNAGVVRAMGMIEGGEVVWERTGGAGQSATA